MTEMLNSVPWESVTEFGNRCKVRFNFKSDSSKSKLQNTGHSQYRCENMNHIFQIIGHFSIIYKFSHYWFNRYLKNNTYITTISSAAGQLEQHTATTNEGPLKLAQQVLSEKLQHMLCILTQPPVVLSNHDIGPMQGQKTLKKLIQERHLHAKKVPKRKKFAIHFLL